MRATWAQFCGSTRLSHESFATVKLATGTLPTCSAHQASPRWSTHHFASAADCVSFQSLAFRTTLFCASSVTRPCCWPATEIAAGFGEPACSSAELNAEIQSLGLVSLTGATPVLGCAARPDETSSPESKSRTSTFVDCVDESTPITNGISYRTPRISSVTNWSRRSWA
jgi:hypothetical protein